MRKAREQIESSSKIEVTLNSLGHSINGLIEGRRQIQELLEELRTEGHTDLVSDLDFNSIEQIIERIQILEADVRNYSMYIEEEKRRKKIEDDQYKKDILALSEYEDKRNKLEEELAKIENTIAVWLQGLGVDTLDALFSKHGCASIDQLITKRQTLEKIVEEKVESLSMFKRTKILLQKDVNTREQAIKKLEEKESQVLAKENYLRHARYLRGEIDGFISNYIVEGSWQK